MSINNIMFHQNSLLSGVRFGSGKDIRSEQGDGAEEAGKDLDKQIEENNNEIDLLTKNFSEMGNINRCNAKRRMSNDSGDFKNDEVEIQTTNVNKYKNVYLEEVVEETRGRDRSMIEKAQSSFEYASDDFEEDSESHDIKPEDAPKSPTIVDKNRLVAQKTRAPNIKTEPSCVQCKQSEHEKMLPERFYERSQPDYLPCSRSQSRSSFQSGSTARRQRKINMSFSNERSMEIERENGILLRKILKSRDIRSAPTSSTNLCVKSKLSSSAIARDRAQQKIQYENLILLKKIQKTKPTHASMRK